MQLDCEIEEVEQVMEMGDLVSSKGLMEHLLLLQPVPFALTVRCRKGTILKYFDKLRFPQLMCSWDIY